MRFAHLVEFLHALPRELPPQLAASARTALIDNLGCGLFGATREWGRMITDHVREEGSRGRATVYGGSETIAPARAALANGTCTHGFELDDIIMGALAHPGAVVVPAALAAAESTQADGHALLRAIVAGYEVMARVGAALGHDHNNRGFHTTGIAGPVAAAVAAGMVMDLPLDALHSAVGTACSSASGLKAFTQGTGGMVKRMHAGRAAESGVLACELARRGFAGPQAGVDGRFGLLEVIGGAHVYPERLDEALGKDFAVNRVWIKAYACCGLIHSTMHALEHLKAAHAIVPGMIANKWGRIVNLTGTSEPYNINASNPAKAAVHAWSKGLSRECARHGITINCIQPGRITSEQMLRMHDTEEKRHAFTREVPMQRFGEPNELADLAIFLASPRASYITGTVIPVDGGLSRFAF